MASSASGRAAGPGALRLTREFESGELSAHDRAVVQDALASVTTMLYEFLTLHRDELIRRTREKVVRRLAPRATEKELANGVPLFLRQLTESLRRADAPSDDDESDIGRSAAHHGGELLLRGFTVAQVVHDYGDVCQAVTELAVELKEPITADEFHSFNRCLDDAMSQAVTGYQDLREEVAASQEVERLGFFAHELRNLLQTATISFEALKRGNIGINGATEVRLASGPPRRSRVRVAEFIEELEVAATIEANNRSLQLSVGPVDYRLMIEVDRQLLASAVTNLLHNAFKYTRLRGCIALTTNATPERVRIEIEDECGGLPPGKAEDLFLPFEQRGVDRAGLGLGLTISRRAIDANGGKLSVRDLPGKGCVFTADLPRAFRTAGESGVTPRRAASN
jgi:signal transduction histidine kinase